MSYRAVFAPEAHEDLRNLYDFIADRAGENQALSYIEAIERFCRGFREFPERGVRRDELFVGLRVIGFKRRVSIAFHIQDRTVTIDRILYAGRDIGRAFRHTR